jgi:hypothetical protein
MGTRLVLFLLCAATANAQSFTRDAFDTQAARWAFKCEQKQLKGTTPQQRQALFTRFKETVWKGISEVQALNPQLVERMHANVIEGSGKFVVSCAEPLSDSSHAAFYESATNHMFRIGQIGIGLGRGHPELRLGGAFVECLRADRAPEESISYQHIGKGGVISPYPVSVRRVNQEACDMTLFHEFLHFAKVDNVDRDVHNDFRDLFGTGGLSLRPAH